MSVRWRLDVREKETDPWEEWGSYATRVHAERAAARHITYRYHRIVKDFS